MPGTTQIANHIHAKLGFVPVEQSADNRVLRQPSGCAGNGSPEVVFFRRALP